MLYTINGVSFTGAQLREIVLDRERAIDKLMDEIDLADQRIEELMKERDALREALEELVDASIETRPSKSHLEWVRTVSVCKICPCIAGELPDEIIHRGECPADKARALLEKIT